MAKSAALADPDDEDWVFLAVYRCARCGRTNRLLQYAGDGLERRAYRNLRVCPDGCESAAAVD